MDDEAALGDGRYLLFLDILGFSELVATRPAEEVYAVVDTALTQFERWEELNDLFGVIYFSDTFLLYQKPKGYAEWAFLDIYAIGGMLLSALLANGIAARGAITFGEFEIRLAGQQRHHVYFGRALVEAYRAEQKENWIGITVQPSAWEPWTRSSGVAPEGFPRAWLERCDRVLLLNPFIKLRGWYDLDLIGEIDKPYLEWDAPEFPNDILAFAFLRSEARRHADAGDFSGRVAVKYHATRAFLHEVMGPAMFAWAERLADTVAPTCASSGKGLEAPDPQGSSIAADAQE